MKRIRDTYGSARVYQNFSGTWKVELNLGGTLHYFNADTKEEAVEIANAQTNGGRVVIEDSKTRKSMKRVRDTKDDFKRLVNVIVTYKGGYTQDFVLDYYPYEVEKVYNYFKESIEKIGRIRKIQVNTGGQFWETIYEDGKVMLSDSRKIKDSNIAYSVLDENDRLLDEFTSKEKAIAYAEKNNKADGVIRFKYSEDGDVLDSKEIWTKNKSVSDSRKVSDVSKGDLYGDMFPSTMVYKLMKKDENARKGYINIDDFFSLSEAREALNEYRKENPTDKYFIRKYEVGFRDINPNYEDINDSRKIKDAEGETPDVLDGILLIAFDDGEEENGYNEVKKHANEQGTIDGVQYETYDTDYQDGATLIDLCAATDDANGFVKALLSEWGIIDEVVDIDFEMSDLMKGEVSDSKRVSDMTKPAHLRGYAERQRKKRRETRGNNETSLYDMDLNDDEIYDSERVSDMIKPAHLRGYAERSRQKRRAKQGQVSREENADTDDDGDSDKNNIADSRDARFFVYKNRQDVTPDQEGFVRKSDAIAFAKTMVDDNDRTMVEVYRYDENDEWGNIEQTVWTSNSQPKTDLEYWGVKEVEIKKVKEGEYFTLKPIPEPKESQVWVKGGYDRSYKEYDAYKYSDVNSYRGFKPNKKVYVGFTF